MQRKILYFLNPVSGNNKKDVLLKAIHERTEQAGIPYEILHTNLSGYYSFLREKIIGESITDVVICGGDGTVNQIAGALLGLDVRIGIIPAGSGNGLALAAKIPVSIHKALDIIFNGKASYIDGFSVNTAFSFMLSGLGFDALIAHEFSKKTKRGLIAYLKLCTQKFFGAQTYSFNIKTKQGFFKTEAYFVSIANSNQFGNHVTIAPKAKLNDGLLDIIVVKKMNKLNLLWSISKQILFGYLQSQESVLSSKKNILYYQARKITIENLSSALLHIDGEPAPLQTSVRAEVIPNAFKLIQP